MKKLVTVVLNWNGLEHTRALLPTLARCRTPEGWRLETLVVDNGSTDGSVEALRAEFPQVTLLELSENRRFAGGNNEGVRVALADGADAVMLLNNDTVVDAELYERLVQALEQDPRAGAAAPIIYFGAPTDLIWYAGGICVPALGLSAHRGGYSRDRGQYRAVEETGYITGCCLLARRETWERVGLLDERYFIYAEDADWSLRARAAGYRLLFVPGARVWHEVSAKTGIQCGFKIYHVLRANWTLFDRHARGLARLTWAPAFVIQQGLFTAVLLARGRFRLAQVVWRGIWDALTGKPPSHARV